MALREAGYHPLPRWWVTTEQLELVAYMAKQNGTEVNRIRAEANGWKRLVTNSAKMVNILGGYGYVPMLASMEECVQSAVTGKI